MKHKTSELTGALLDAAVAKADGREYSIEPYRVSGDGMLTLVRGEPVCIVGIEYFEPSTSWAIGGPRIERERITVQASQAGDWRAFLGDGTTNACAGRRASEPLTQARGETPLIAAMRAFVASKLGDEVELPAAQG